MGVADTGYTALGVIVVVSDCMRVDIVTVVGSARKMVAVLQRVVPNFAAVPDAHTLALTMAAASHMMKEHRKQ